MKCCYYEENGIIQRALFTLTLVIFFLIWFEILVLEQRAMAEYCCWQVGLHQVFIPFLPVGSAGVTAALTM